MARKYTASEIVALVRTAKALKVKADKADEIAKTAVRAENERTGRDTWESDDGTVKLSAVAGREGFDKVKVKTYLTAEQYAECVTHSKPTVQVRFTMPVTLPAVKAA
jgi:hypothetical protein